jgi:RNA polymerase sigma-70 factor (ECF subfamily)
MVPEGALGFEAGHVRQSSIKQSPEPERGEMHALHTGEPAESGATASIEDDLCERLKAGDAAAAGLVYERIVRIVDAALYRLLGANDYEFEDLKQQALERVITTIVSGRYQRGCGLTYWTTLITHHLAVDAFRSRTRSRRVFDFCVDTGTLEHLPDPRQSTDKLVEIQRRSNRLISILASIPREQADAVVLYDLLGHDLAEVARLTSVSIAAAQSRLVRGRRNALRLLASSERPKRRR